MCTTDPHCPLHHSTLILNTASPVMAILWIDAFENIVEKRENAAYQHLLLSHYFSCPIKEKFDNLSTFYFFVFNVVTTIFCYLEKELNADYLRKIQTS